jgi:D-serine deaminase-like pyridoxal phosphate-dependent protein
VAKVSEAAAMVKAGVKQVHITSPVVTPKKIECLFDTLASAPDLMVVVDNGENARALSAEASKRGLSLRVLIDISPTMGRTGVEYEDALPLGRMIVQLPGLHLVGIQCYAGMVQHIGDFAQRREASLRVMLRAAEVFLQMREEGLPCEIFSGTGTGTFDIDAEIPEITDFQVGSYCVMDAEYGNIGSMDNPEKYELFKPALTLLTSVVSVNQPDFVTVDAGLKSVYFTPHAPPWVLNPSGKGWAYEWFGDEHGRIYFPHPDLKPELGDVLELTASHCDPTINLYDYIWIARDGKIIDRWPIDLRGCNR